ncbi:MAG: hypothetical protein HC904_13095 [Blastochloris sp.]|nr:hypothetical protein [Blastochloris sp.]
MPLLSRLARQGLKPPAPEDTVMKIRNGIPVFPSRGEIITMEHIQRIMDEEGI